MKILDRPVWTSLQTVNARFARCLGKAARYDPQVEPFAGTADDQPACLNDLARLVGREDRILMVQRDPIVLPDELITNQSTLGVQMVARDANLVPPTHLDAVPLGLADTAEMRALAELTRPGPFLERTHELGGFFGVRIDGRLAAMAGERMKQPGMTEVSGVCCHPDFRGRGLARGLSQLVAARIIARGEIPYLHTYADNAAAIGLYRSLGFEIRCEVNIAVVEHR